MRHKSPSTGPDLQALLTLFPPNDFIASADPVPGDAVPEPYHSLLVHEHHMTVTVEEHHGDLVDVRVLATRVDGDAYSRKILLALQKTGKVVMFGIPRVHLQVCSDEVRAEILAQNKPLGRILIEHNVLRRIEPTGFLRVVPGPAMMQWFGLDTPRPTYGRLAWIYYNGQPAVELLEIVAPE